MRQLEVFADVACPFTHVGVRRFVAERGARGRAEPVLRFRSWPLEIVNDGPLEGPALAPKVAALRAGVAPELFEGFDPTAFPTTTVPAMAAEQAAWAVSADMGERVALALRHALFEEGRDVGDPDVVAAVLADHGAPVPSPDHEELVGADHLEGQRRGVQGSPHFFLDEQDFYCPSLEVDHPDGGIEVSFDQEGFEHFMSAVLR